MVTKELNTDTFCRMLTGAGRKSLRILAATFIASALLSSCSHKGNVVGENSGHSLEITAAGMANLDNEALTAGNQLIHTAMISIPGAADDEAGTTDRDANHKNPDALKGMRVVKIPAGKFLMGSPATDLNRSFDESQRLITLTRDFYMSKYQITNIQYAKFLNASGVGSNGKGNLDGHGTGVLFVSADRWGVTFDSGAWKAQAGYESHPVIYVTWHGALAYALWAGGTLPTEAQWEYACRGGKTTVYSYEDKADGNYMWYANNSSGNTKAVGGKLPNAYGLHDMHGNVWEWCNDWYGAYSETATEDPTGPASGNRRVLRGGGWFSYARPCRSAHRSFNQPDGTRSSIGFRVVFVP